ncbi:hypothetical protein EYF80_022679 [Liparis tanakae]|uniref:Uncharacterized protein n=1 Tax=Liparis tanakae TaxID=230148 RepID=A0A4Z2HMQ1_9TELE|nr:hypothetical protein EYF80_022679 [Liparis tanakae]
MASEFSSYGAFTCNEKRERRHGSSNEVPMRQCGVREEELYTSRLHDLGLPRQTGCYRKIPRKY